MSAESDDKKDDNVIKELEEGCENSPFDSKSEVQLDLSNNSTNKQGEILVEKEEKAEEHQNPEVETEKVDTIGEESSDNSSLKEEILRKASENIDLEPKVHFSPSLETANFETKGEATPKTVDQVESLNKMSSKKALNGYFISKNHLKLGLISLGALFIATILIVYLAAKPSSSLSKKPEKNKNEDKFNKTVLLKTECPNFYCQKPSIINGKLSQVICFKGLFIFLNSMFIF
jgi:hypothetical protein